MQKKRAEAQTTEEPKNKKRRGKGCLGLIVIIVVAAIGISIAVNGSGDDDKTDSRCESVNASMIDAIAEGMSGTTLSRAEAVKSGDFDSVWFIAGIVEGSNKNPGLWASNDITQARAGLIYSVNDVALEVSDWGNGTTTDAALSPNDDGAQEAIDCVNSN
jgi:hypothetical protein